MSFHALSQHEGHTTQPLEVRLRHRMCLAMGKDDVFFIFSKDTPLDSTRTISAAVNRAQASRKYQDIAHLYSIVWTHTALGAVNLNTNGNRGQAMIYAFAALLQWDNRNLFNFIPKAKRYERTKWCPGKQSYASRDERYLGPWFCAWICEAIVCSHIKKDCDLRSQEALTADGRPVHTLSSWVSHFRVRCSIGCFPTLLAVTVHFYFISSR